MLPLALLTGGRRRVNWANANVVLDGNSLFAGSYHSSGKPGVTNDLKARAPFNNVPTFVNVAQSGQTFSAMLANHSDVDAAYAVGKDNVLIVWEIINSVWVGQTGAQAFASLLAYLAAVRAVHADWIVVVVTGTYRHQATDTGDGSTLTPLQCNQEIDNCNALIRAGTSANRYKVADIRQSGSPFNLPNTGTVASDYSSTYYATTTDGTDGNGPIIVHQTDAGFNYTLGVQAATCVGLRVN